MCENGCKNCKRKCHPCNDDIHKKCSSPSDCLLRGIVKSKDEKSDSFFIINAFSERWKVKGSYTCFGGYTFTHLDGIPYTEEI